MTGIIGIEVCAVKGSDALIFICCICCGSEIDDLLELGDIDVTVVVAAVLGIIKLDWNIGTILGRNDGCCGCRDIVFSP